MGCREVFIYIMKFWECSLCNIQLPDDELINVRKDRHRSFHVDESIGTNKRQRNWTFGKVSFKLCSCKLCVIDEGNNT
jgi:hypothetical protein